jgi:hypothetical protein
MASLCVAGLVACTGCNTSPTGGRTTVTTARANDGSVTTHASSSKKESFELKGPTSTPMTRVEQGTSKTVKISINRGSDFKDDVALKAQSADPKVHVTLEPNAFKGSEKKDVEAVVKADADAKLGEDDITITGTPQSGAPTTLLVKVDVTPKANHK